MLVQLRVGNLALVDDLSVTLGPGLTIMTGETGAGKSLIAGALSLLAGTKSDRELIRPGEELAYVEGVFDLSGRPDLATSCQGLGLRLAGDQILVLRREIKRHGRGRVLINGLVSSLALLEDLGRHLLAVQSQDQQRTLSRPGFALDFLDSVLGLEDQRNNASLALEIFRRKSRDLEQRRREEDLASQQLAVWEYQLEELEKADLQEGEEEQLAEKINLGRDTRGLLEVSQHSREILTEADLNARQILGTACSQLTPLAGNSPRLQAILGQLEEAQSLVQEASADLERLVDSVDIDPARLDEMEARHSLYAELRRKFQKDVTGLMELQETLSVQVRRQKSAAEDLEALTAEVEEARGQLETACGALHDLRLSGKDSVARLARDLIRPLALPDIELEFAVEWRTDEAGDIQVQGSRCQVSKTGADVVSLLVRTNPGQVFGEVGKIASGGEKSRIFLGLTVLAGQNKAQPVMLFDEIDAGLGMDNAVPVAGLLERLSADGQVLCITHLPTVAAHGQQHLKVSKTSIDDETVVTVTEMDQESRVEEIARLLGGEFSGEAAASSQVEYARKLLAAKFRESSA